MIIRLVSIEETIAKIVDDLNLGDRDIPFESMVEWIASGLKRIGAYDQFEKKTARIKVTDFRGELPSDFYRVNSEAFNEPHKIGNNTITIGYKTATIDLPYLAMPVDERGYPLVPEEEAYQEALLWLVASKLSMRGELPNKDLKYDYCDSRWKRFMLSARAEANMGDIQFLQRRGNDFRKLKYNTNPLRNGGIGSEEYLKRS